MTYWWVNQNQTYKYEVSGGFLWSPKTRADGGKNYFYSSMEKLKFGDVVFSFCDTFIKAIGIVQASAITAPKPEFRSAGSNWLNMGWYAEVEFVELPNPIKPKDFMKQIAPLLAEKYAPLQPNGKGLQGVYLTDISDELGKLLISLASADVESLKSELASESAIEMQYEIDLEIHAKGIEGDLEKIQLVKARRGQGVFKSNVRLVESSCRVTGVHQLNLLIASHIKPWRKSNDEEKIDGFNGLLLAPHVDRLFDRGLMSFKQSGELLISPRLDLDVLNKWNISQKLEVGNFRAEQENYLEYHRDEVFKSA
jgi:putative restriction endonuclease